MAWRGRLSIYAILCLASALLFVITDIKLNTELAWLSIRRIQQLPDYVIHRNPCSLRLGANCNPTSFKQILIWNSPNRIEAAAFGTGYDAFLKNNCTYKHCVILTDTSLANLTEIDALLINVPTLRLSKLPNFQRQPFQRFVFFTQESPFFSRINFQKFAIFFNWTMSYRKDSDVGLVYGRVTPKLNTTGAGQMPRFSAVTGTTNYATNKTKLVAWFVSHCGTPGHGEKYVKKLQKYIPVDVYGGCGNMSCKINHTAWISDHECYHMLEKTYKFYLSFENSICVDYVTEKLFYVLQHRIVPIVYGGANYSEIAPEHSYIDANVLSPKELASLLTTLDKNDTMYNEYFWWKEYYDVEADVELMSRHAFCDLCEKLHTDFEVKVYDTMATTWDPKTQCSKPRTF